MKHNRGKITKKEFNGLFGFASNSMINDLRDKGIDTDSLYFFLKGDSKNKKRLLYDSPEYDKIEEHQKDRLWTKFNIKNNILLANLSADGIREWNNVITKTRYKKHKN